MIILNNPTLGLNSEHLGPLVELIREYRKHKNLKYLIVATDDQHFIELLEGQIYHVTKTDLLQITPVFKKVS